MANCPPNPLQVAKDQLAAVARHVEDRTIFLKLAAEEWDRTHFWKAPKRGRRSVAEPCFQAIEDGYSALPKASWLESFNDLYQELTIECFEPLPQGRLAQMIRDRVPWIKASTVIKYARIWERERGQVMSGDLSTRRLHGMELFKKTKKARPVLYRKHKPESLP